jgi:hypothetical protein
LVAILYLGYHGNGRHFDFFNTPKATTYYGGFESKMLPKYKNPPIWEKFGFQVDYDVAN